MEVACSDNNQLCTVHCGGDKGGCKLEGGYLQLKVLDASLYSSKCPALPTTAPSASPTKSPTLSPPDAFDCDAHSFPIQVVLPTSATFGVDSFIVAEMDLNTGEYNSLYLLDQIDARYVFLLCRGARCVVEKRF
jgi:hypothetical protein